MAGDAKAEDGKGDQTPGAKKGSTVWDFLRELQKYVLGAVVGGAFGLMFQYKWWYEQERINSAKDKFQKSYQTIIDFSELLHRRFYATNVMWLDYTRGQPIKPEDKKRYLDILYEWNYKIDTFHKQFETLFDRPFYEELFAKESPEVAVTYANWKDIDCGLVFEKGNGSSAKWSLMNYYTRLFDHCLFGSVDFVMAFADGRKIAPETAAIELQAINPVDSVDGSRPDQPIPIRDRDNFLEAVEASYHNLYIFRDEAMKRALCLYNEKTSDTLWTFIGLSSRRRARDEASCQVTEIHFGARDFRVRATQRRAVAPPEPPAQSPRAP